VVLAVEAQDLARPKNARQSGQEMIKAYMQNKTVWINNSTLPPGNPFVMPTNQGVVG